jgi:hypothetical protein
MFEGGAFATKVMRERKQEFFCVICWKSCVKGNSCGHYLEKAEWIQPGEEPYDLFALCAQCRGPIQDGEICKVCCCRNCGLSPHRRNPCEECGALNKNRSIEKRIRKAYSADLIDGMLCEIDASELRYERPCVEGQSTSEIPKCAAAAHAHFTVHQHGFP